MSIKTAPQPNTEPLHLPTIQFLWYYFSIYDRTPAYTLSKFHNTILADTTVHLRTHF
nr:MAG TPA: hypothetical protein [Caudoviricetes sp.]